MVWVGGVCGVASTSERTSGDGGRGWTYSCGGHIHGSDGMKERCFPVSSGSGLMCMLGFGLGGMGEF